MKSLSRVYRWLPLVVFVLTLVWYTALMIRYQTHGAIGDDPATYVQMGLDLAQHNTVVHSFPLFTNLFDQGLSWDAFITPGYHVVATTGVTAPNFAFGFPLALSFGYRIFGESALYLTTPLLGLLSLVLTFALGRKLWSDALPTRRNWIGALAVLMLATTPKQIQLGLVPMSDVPTQFFCLLALWGALEVTRPKAESTASNLRAAILFAALAGIALGLAYLLRHSALVLVIPLAYIVMRWGNSRRERILLVLIALTLFALVSLPDVLYRTNVLGSPIAVESAESTQTDLLGAPLLLIQMVAALFSMTGIGPILLLVPLGIWQLVRKGNRFAAVVLVTWAAAFILFHAPLRLTGVFENSLRYLVPIYPALTLTVAGGCVTLIDWGWRAFVPRRKPFQIRLKPTRWELALLGAIATLFLFAAAIRAVAGPERFVLRSYGWMSEAARNDLDVIAQHLPPNAVVGVSDQMAGAALLYTGRDIFRPANFLEPSREFPQFLQLMKSENRPVYLLGDWNCSSLANPSEMLPRWLEAYPFHQTDYRVTDLPYECLQNLSQYEGD